MSENISNISDSQTESVIKAIYEWQDGSTSRGAVVGLLTALMPSQGFIVSSVISRINSLIKDTQNTQQTNDKTTGNTDEWRNELMSSRAKTWEYPNPAGLLVGPDVLILTDGSRGVILHPDHSRPLPSSTSGTIMLLAQTIVMAQNAVDTEEFNQLQKQRIDSNSNSLSEIEPIR